MLLLIWWLLRFMFMRQHYQQRKNQSIRERPSKTGFCYGEVRLPRVRRPGVLLAAACGGDHGALVDGLPDEEPPEKKRHYWIYKRISRHPRRRAFLQNIDVRGETHHRPEHNQISKRRPRTCRNSSKMETHDLSRQYSRNPQGNPTRKALHRRSHQG